MLTYNLRAVFLTLGGRRYGWYPVGHGPSLISAYRSTKRFQEAQALRSIPGARSDAPVARGLRENEPSRRAPV